MKCDGLEKFDATSNAERSAGIESRYAYDANEVDAAIAELKAENERLRKAVSDRHDKYCNLQETIDRLECKLECVKENKDKELRATNRALWLARAERAHAEWGHWATIWFCDTSIELNINKSSVCQGHHKCTLKRNAATWRNIWSEVEHKCRAKAEEYK